MNLPSKHYAAQLQTHIVIKNAIKLSVIIIIMKKYYQRPTISRILKKRLLIKGKKKIKTRLKAFSNIGLLKLQLRYIKITIKKIFSSKSKIFQLLTNWKSLEQEHMTISKCIKQASLEQYLILMATKRSSNKFIAYYHIWNIYLSQRNPSKALQLLEKCKDQFLCPCQQHMIYFGLGMAKIHLLQYDEAFRYLMKYQKMIYGSFQDSQFLKVCVNRGLSQVQLNQVAMFNIFFKQSLKTQSLNLQNTQQRIVYIQNKENFEQKNNTIQRIFNINEANPQISSLLELGSKYYEQQKYSQAAICCLQIIRLDQTHLSAYLRLQDVYFMLQNYSKSLYYCNKAIELKPFQPESLCGLGQIQYGLHQYQCAIYYLIESIKINFNQLCLLYLIKIWQQKGQIVIQKLKEQYLKIHSNQLAQWNLAITLNVLGYSQYYYSYLSHVNQPIEADIIPQNCFLLFAFTCLKNLWGMESIKRSLSLDLGILCLLLKRQEEATKYYQKLMKIIQGQTKSAAYKKNQYQIFLQFYKQKLVYKEDRYRILICYFFLSEIFKIDKNSAMKSIIWLYKNEPQTYYFTAFTQLIYQNQEISKKHAVLAYQFAGYLLKQLNLKNLALWLHKIQQKIKLQAQNILKVFKIGLIDTIKKCFQHSPKYIKFLLSLKEDKVVFQLNKLIDTSVAQGAQLTKIDKVEDVKSSYFRIDNHIEFLHKFGSIKQIQKKKSFTQAYAIECVIKSQLAKFIYNLLAQYVYFRKNSLKQFANSLKEIVFNFDQFNVNLGIDIINKIMTKSEGQNSKMQTMSYRYNLVSHQGSIRTNTSISQQDFIERVVKQGIYSKIIKQENLEFGLNSPRLEVFRKLFLKNSYLLPQYLFHQYCKPKNIVKFFIERQQNQKAPKFQLLMEKGEQIQIQEDYVCGSRNRFYSWIADIAKAIAEIEAMGIFHADIKFDNTIAITQANQLTFKLIDFGRAFKVKLVKAETKQLKIYVNTVKMMENMLNLACVDQDYSIIQFIFKPIDERNSKQLIQSLANKLILLQPQQCLQQLWKHSQRSHLSSYCRLVQSLLKYAEDAADAIISTEQLSEMRQKINNLREGKIGWNQFIGQVQDAKDK